MEYLAAGALVNQSKTLVDTLLTHITDEWWEQVILLAGAHPKTAEDVRVDLITKILEWAATLPHGSEEHIRHLIIAGELVRDMAEYLPGPEHQLVEDALFAAATDGSFAPVQRASAANTLDELGYQPDDLFVFIPIPNPRSPDFLITRYPITNLQYERFLQPENFKDKSLWTGFPKYAEPDKKVNIVEIGKWEDEGWDWLGKALKDKDNLVENGVLYPRYWRDPRFGSSRRTVPVVTVTWYEANAYCKWLLENWDALEESKQPGAFKPKVIRLPTESEWVAAACGEENDRFAFGTLKDPEKEIARYANTRESGINRTTPVWMYPQGESPNHVMDMSGNVWEWQANFRDKDHDVLSLRGGSWDDDQGDARVSFRYDNHPGDRDLVFGFRVVAFPS